MNKAQVSTVVLLAGCSFASIGQTLEDGVRERVESGVANWVNVKKTPLTSAARVKLFSDVAAAREEVKKRNPSLKCDALDDATPRAVVTYLDRSADNKETASLSSLIEQSIFATGSVLPALTDYPTLVVKVNPEKSPDFVVTIDGDSFASGASTFRVRVGVANVRVARDGRALCASQVIVTASGPNVFVCNP